jgi:hypothetical protein
MAAKLDKPLKREIRIGEAALAAPLNASLKR